MKTHIFFLLLLLACAGSAMAQVPLRTGDLPGLTVTSSETIDAEHLPEYKGSDAALYQEYGFSSLLVQYLSYNNEDLRLEVYNMNTPEAAYGVYSVSVVRCNFRDTVAGFDCQSRFQYQAANGNQYIFLTAPSGNPRIGYALLSVARMFINANPPSKAFALPEVFKQGRPQSAGKMVYFASGPAGLQNCPFPWQNMMYGIRFSMYATLIPDQWGDIFFARITFPQQGDLNRFLNAAGLMDYNTPVTSRLRDGIFHEYQTTRDPLTILFLESQQTISIRQITGGN